MWEDGKKDDYYLDSWSLGVNFFFNRNVNQIKALQRFAI